MSDLAERISAQAQALHRGCPDSSGSPLGNLMDEWAAELRRIAGEQEGVVRVPEPFVQFLLGARPHDGVEFRELHPTKRGRFWWRTDLQAMLDAAVGL